MHAEARLVALKLELPPAPAAMGVYQPVTITGNLAFVSGHVGAESHNGFGPFPLPLT